MKKIVLSLIVLLNFQGQAFASGYYGPITTVITSQWNEAFIYVQSQPNGTIPACATLTKAPHNRYVIKTSTTGGKAMLATAMLAFSLGKNVSINGQGDWPSVFPNACDVWGDTESIHLISISK